MSISPFLPRRAGVRLGLAALTVAVLCVFGVASPAAATLKLHSYRARIFGGPHGSRSGLFAISDDGTAVGQRLLADGTSHSLVLRPRPFGSQGLQGKQSALIGINSMDEAAGTLFASAGGKNPVFFSTNGQVETLQANGDANAIAIGPLVAVTATGADGTDHVLVWDPRTGAVRDQGPGEARGINADGTVVGRTVGGQAAYWSPDGVLHALPFPGVLVRVNLFGQAVGYTAQTGGPTPIVLDLRQPSVVTNLELPRGWRFGSAKGIADNGRIVGDAYRNAAGGLPSEAILWTNPRKPVPLQNLARHGSAKDFQFADADGIDDNGLIVGAVVRSRSGRTASVSQDQDEFAFVYQPAPDWKLDGLDALLAEVKQRGVDTTQAELLVKQLRHAATRLAKDPGLGDGPFFQRGVDDLTGRLYRYFVAFAAAGLTCTTNVAFDWAGADAVYELWWEFLVGPPPVDVRVPPPELPPNETFAPKPPGAGCEVI